MSTIFRYTDRTMKVTQSSIKNFLKNKLATDKAWALRGLTRIYEKQTLTEKAAQNTSELNGVGFSGADAEILSSFAEQYQRKGFLSEKQMALVLKKMPRYWGQIQTLIPEDKLSTLVLNESSTAVAPTTA